MGFDTDIAAGYDAWYETPKGKYADAREKELFLRLVQPQKGQTLLEVGCGTGHNLEFFAGLGLDVTGVDCSPSMLCVAASRLGPRSKLCLGQAGELGFADNSFDIVTLITVLEFLPEPAKALKEAMRVSRDKVFVGVLNKASILAVLRRLEGKFRKTIYRQARFYTIWEVERLITEALGRVRYDWGSVLSFPLGWHRYCHRFDQLLSFKKNPFGAFLGLCLTKPHPVWTD